MEEDQKWGAADKSKVGRTCNEFYPCKKPFWRNCKDLSAITVCIALSVLSFGVCLLVFLRTSDLHSRILNLEKQRETQVSAWISLEQVEPVILGRLDQILEEVRIPLLDLLLLFLRNIKSTLRDIKAPFSHPI